MMPLLAPALLAATLAVPAPAAQDEASRPSYEELEQTIREEIEWLKALQDPTNGSYEGGVEGTARALEVLALSPDRYRYGDGPFVDAAVDYLLVLRRPDGAILGPDDREEMAPFRTMAAAKALELFDHPLAQEIAAHARAALDFPSAAQIHHEMGARRAGLTEEEVLDQANELLTKRVNEHMWANADGVPDFKITLTRIDFLNGFYNLLRARRDGRPVAGWVPPHARELAEAEKRALAAALRRGADHLVALAPDGRWGVGDQDDPGVSAMVAAALAAMPDTMDVRYREQIDAALDWVKTFQQEDGSIHAGQLRNYVTSAAVLAMAAAERPQDEEAIARARAFLEDLQIDEGEGSDPSDPFYGGVGYGGDGRPDLSNLQMALEALAEAGAEPGDEPFAKALRFLERCQNRSESNDVRLEVEGVGTVRSGDDGGSAYMPGESKAGYVTLPDGTKVPRSYGSMTYALLKSYVLAGLDEDDERVQAAWRWIRESYTTEINPGFQASEDPNAPYQGLFYYYLAMARTLKLFADPLVVLPSGELRDWRRDLARTLTQLQRQDGSWVNANAERWYEGNPALATAYAMLAIAELLPEAPPGPAGAEAGPGGGR